MSEGLKALLEAAQFIEQQEKLKLSPQATTIPSILNEQQQRFIVHAYDATIAAAAAATANTTTMITINGHLNGGSINIRNSNMRQGNVDSLQVSSSAPASAATFQHDNCHHNQHHNNCGSITTATSLHPALHVATNVLSNGTNIASTTTTTHQQHHRSVQRNPHVSLNHHQQKSQLLNASHHDYDNITLAVTSPSSTGATCDNLLQQSSLNGRSSEGRISDDANSSNKSNDTSNTSLMLLTNSTASKLLKIVPSSPTPMAVDEEPDDDVLMKLSGLETTTDGDSTATFSLAGRSNECKAVSNEEMLLTIGHSQQESQVSLCKTTSIKFSTKNVPIINGFSYLLTPSGSSSSQHQQSPGNGGSSSLGGGSSNIFVTNHRKTFIPLTPPPMSSRNFVESAQSRMRSFSLSSHKISANNHHQLHVQNGNNNNNNNSMVVDEISPTHSSYATNSSSSQNSPPRHMSSSLGSSAGTHYMHMINAASSQQAAVAGSGANHIAHATPRRRTISSTSNGAGTREVHNKLEKNRRAHLKECYESLKNQLSLKDEDRRKTSNLAILGEALKCVQSFQKRNQELEVEWEHLANDKINLQKRIVSLKRELGPKYEQIFSGIFPDIEIGSIPSERETTNDTHSLSSGRGSTLYSSSSSLSSGGSNGSSSSNGGSGSNTMSSPVGAGIQTAMPTTISPVINKINNSININSTSPISINSNNTAVQYTHQQQHQRKNASIITALQAVAIPTQGVSGGGGMSSPPAGSPTTVVTFGSSLPLSLTAKNISATAVTRGSPTPSTPSPSPSSSSGVSSSSSVISSSPPINGVISNGRNVTINIPNGLKLQSAAAAGSGINGNGVGGSNCSSTSAAATILTTSKPAQEMLGNQQSQQQNGRKKNLSLSNNGSNNNTAELKHNHQHQPQQKQLQQQQQQVCEDGEQPAKFLKVFNALTAPTNGHHQPQLREVKSQGQKLLLTSNGGILQGGGCGGNNNTSINIGGSIAGTTAVINKSINNGSAPYTAAPATITSTNEMCRLPGGAELNILPSNGLKVSSSGLGPVATAFYHANGKITFVNGPLPHHQYQYQPPSSSLPSSTAVNSNGTTTIANGFLLKDSSSVTPILVSAASSSTTSSVSSLHFDGNFAHLLADTTGHSNSGLENVTPPAVSAVPMTTNFPNIAETKAQNNKSPFVSWRSGAATTN